MGTFISAVKNLVNSLTAKTSSTASTADMVQLHDANGNPNGKISLADLASVLGGINLINATRITSGDLYEILADKIGLFYYPTSASNNIENKPSNGPCRIISFAFMPKTSDQMAIAFNSYGLFYNMYWNNQWTGWKKFSFEEL